VRRLLVQEMPRIFDASRYGVAAAVDTEHPKAASAFGGSANGGVFMFQLDRLLAHIRPPQPFVPTSIVDRPGLRARHGGRSPGSDVR
jgi:hypothetical protein